MIIVALPFTDYLIGLRERMVVHWIPVAVIRPTGSAYLIIMVAVERAWYTTVYMEKWEYAYPTVCRRKTTC